MALAGIRSATSITWKTAGTASSTSGRTRSVKKIHQEARTERKTVVSIWDVVRKYNHKCNLSLMSRVEKIIISNHFFVKNLFDNIYKNIIIGQT